MAVSIDFEPSYLKLLRTGELRRRVRGAYAMLRACRVCPRNCGVDRLAGELGVCRTGKHPWVSAANAHFGEEPPLTGTRGSGTVFFSNCNLRCAYCQNYPISQKKVGREMTVREVADHLLELQGRGVHNVNFVTPSHVVPQMLASLYAAATRGLRIPIVYNSSGYDSVESLRLLDGVVDVYLPDMKYADDESARKYSLVFGYPSANRAAVREMFRQVGASLDLADDGTVRRGLILRHLVLPNGIAGTPRILEFVARDLSPEVHVSLMGQYFPVHRALQRPEIARSLTVGEYEEAKAALEPLGLSRGWVQEPDSLVDDDDAAA